MTEQMAILKEGDVIKITMEDAMYCAKVLQGAEFCEGCRLYRLCHTFCDEVYGMIVESLEEIQQYRAIGTVEELQALKEKSEPREIAEHNFQDEPHHYLCPNCRNIVNYGQKYCEECGQALKD